jgi:hypothetical protein
LRGFSQLQITVGAKSGYYFAATTDNGKMSQTRRVVMTGFALMLLILGSQPSVSLQHAKYSVADLRGPHDRIDNRVRDANTILLVSFFNTGRMEVLTHCYMMRDHSMGQLGITIQAIHGRFPAGKPMEKIPMGKPHPFLELLKRLSDSQGYRRDDDATFVSWEDAGKWTTRRYDRTRLPPEVRDLFRAMKIPDTWLWADARW